MAGILKKGSLLNDLGGKILGKKAEVVLGDKFGFGPTTVNRGAFTTTNPPITNWNLSASVYRGIYQLQIVDFNNSENGYLADLPTDALDLSRTKFDPNAGAVHEFLTAPQSITLQEQAAATIQPTLGLGKYIDEQGQATKLLTIAGTSGLRPNSDLEGAQVTNPIENAINSAFGDVPVLANTLNALGPTGPLDIGPFQFDDRDPRGLAKGEVTGFDEITRLKNLFRMYFDAKEGKFADLRDPTKIKMVWADFYSYEFWVIVPIAFETSRNGKPFQVDYRIQARTIEPFNKVFSDLFKTKPTKAGTIFSIARQAAREVRDTFVDAKNIVDAIANRTNREIRSTAFASRQAYQAVTAVFNKEFLTGNSFEPISETFGEIERDLKQLLTGDTHRDSSSPNSVNTTTPELKNSSDNADNETIFRRALNTALASKEELSLQDAETTFQDELPGALNDIIRSSAALLAGLASLEIQKDLTVEDIELIKNEFLNLRTSEETGEQFESTDNFGHILDHRNMAQPEALKETQVAVGETIYDIANRIYGTKLAYKQLALINKLRYPYIADVPSEGVLAPGDLLKYAVDPAGLSENNVAVRDRENIEARYGTDIRIAVQDNGYTLAVSPDGDLDVISGKNNLAQAMFLKHQTPMGSIPAHPNYGLPVTPGDRLTPDRLAAIDLRLRAMYLADPRLQAINSIRIRGIEDTILIQSAVKAVGADEPIIQRFGVT